jgi:large conductance mechanosensitive channel
MSVIKEFREFIARGNVIDLAVGVIVGASFNKIVTSLVDQVVMPPIGWLTGGLDFSKLQYVLPDNPATPKVEEVAIQYGAFINTIIQFLLTAVAVFLLVKLVNSARRKQEEAPATETPAAPTPQESLLTEIRDLLKTRPAPAVAVAAPAVKVVAPKPAPAPRPTAPKTVVTPKAAAARPAAAKAPAKPAKKPAPKSK